jgi:hypothetical protein
MGCWLPLKEDNWLDEEDGGECRSHDGGCSHWFKSKPETTTSKLRKPLNLKEDTSNVEQLSTAGSALRQAAAELKYSSALLGNRNRTIRL